MRPGERNGSLFNSELSGLELLHRGKVWNIYASRCWPPADRRDRPSAGLRSGAAGADLRQGLDADAVAVLGMAGAH